MEIDFDALDQVISQKRVSPRASSPSSLKTPKYIDVIQAGAVKRPTITRKSSSMRRVKKVAVKKVEKVEAPPVQSISDLIDRELEAGDTALGEDAPIELNVDDLVAYAESTELEAEIKNVTPEEAAKDFLQATQELAPFLPNVKVEKAPLSEDLPTHVTERAQKSERELASLDIKDDLTADKSELKELEPPKARILTEERIAPKRSLCLKRRAEDSPQRQPESGSRRPSPKKSSTPLIILLGILIAIFGAVAGAFIYLLTND